MMYILKKSYPSGLGAPSIYIKIPAGYENKIGPNTPLEYDPIRSNATPLSLELAKQWQDALRAGSSGIIEIEPL